MQHEFNERAVEHAWLGNELELSHTPAAAAAAVVFLHSSQEHQATRKWRAAPSQLWKVEIGKLFLSFLCYISPFSKDFEAFSWERERDQPSDD